MNESVDVLFSQAVNKYMNAGILAQNKREYYTLLEQLQTWIISAENSVESTQPNSEDGIRAYCRQLEVKGV